MTTGPDNGAELNDQAQDVRAIVAPALQNSDSPAGLPARAYQALQTWPAHDLPHDLWQEILALLPLEDQARLAHTNHHIQNIVGQLAPQALDPTAHTTPDFIRTIYTQTELDTSLNTWRWVEFIPGTDSNLTIGRGLAHAHGPGTLTAVNAGHVTALDDIHITTITNGTVRAYDQATIEEVTGGTVTARDQTTITTVTDGNLYVYDQASIEEVTGGKVRTVDHAHITTVTGGTVRADKNAAVTHVTGGDLHAIGQSTISDVTGGTVTAAEDAAVTVTGGDAHITALGNAHVIIQASADGVHVDAHDTAHITAHSGTITLHSPGVTITSNTDSNAVINHA
ncbi:F-box protein [Streptomyces sp. NPDC057910]|uniref:F-box protein n=1 Tax=Streptomyces sp. NPDC057910 TaxID=3346278 RepID=UPI0036EFCF4C